MKKITLLIALIAFTFNARAQFPETFAGPTNLPAGWEVFDNGIGTTVTWEQNENGYAFISWDENVSAPDVAEDFLASPSYTVDANSTLLTFEATPFTLADYGSTLSVRVQVDEAGSDQTDPSLYTTIQTFTETDLLPELSFTYAEVDLSAYAGQDIFVAFVHSDAYGDAWALRNANFVTPATAAPMAAINPDPADGATVNLFDTGETGTTGQPLLAYEFSFELPAGSEAASSYTFDLGDDATVALFSTTLSSPGITLQGLAMNTTYYWRITSTNNVDSTVGSVWSFTTSGTLGLEDIKAEKVLEHFVNNNTLTINAENAIDQVEIYNMLGQSVKTVNPAQNSANVDLGDLNSGMFISKVTIEGKTQTFKFVK